MSVFRVKLQMLPQQGYMDINPTTSQPFAVSKQRTMYVAGPRRIYRKLFDGQTFSDCNYWKRFAEPQSSRENAFIEIVSDDGSIYSDIEEENTFPRTYMAYPVLIADTFATNFIDILGGLGGAASFVQIQNLGAVSPGQDITVQLNGSVSAAFVLAAGDTQLFNAGDLAVTKLAFDGGAANTTLQIILGVHVQCAS
jgi:hypothetical protein